MSDSEQLSYEDGNSPEQNGEEGTAPNIQPVPRPSSTSSFVSSTPSLLPINRADNNENNIDRENQPTSAIQETLRQANSLVNVMDCCQEQITSFSSSAICLINRLVQHHTKETTDKATNTSPPASPKRPHPPPTVEFPVSKSPRLSDYVFNHDVNEIPHQPDIQNAAGNAIAPPQEDVLVIDDIQDGEEIDIQRMEELDVRRPMSHDEAYYSNEMLRMIPYLAMPPRYPSQTQPCGLCLEEGTHYTQNCHRYVLLGERRRRLSLLKRCWICLRPHSGRCRSGRQCRICGSGTHHETVCPRFDPGDEADLED